MSNNTLIALSIAAVVAIFSLFIINMTPVFKQLQPATGLLSQKTTRGSAVYHDGQPFTLNFAQQQALVNDINRCIAVEKKDFPADARAAAFQKVVVYRFADVDVELVPHALQGRNIIFDAPALNANSYLRDVSEGALATLLNNSFDN